MFFIAMALSSSPIKAQNVVKYTIEKSILTNLEETEIYENSKAKGSAVFDFHNKIYNINISFEDTPNDIYTIKGILKKRETIYYKDPTNKEELCYSCNIIMDEDVDNGSIYIEKKYNGDTIISFLSDNSSTIRSIYVK